MVCSDNDAVMDFVLSMVDYGMFWDVVVSVILAVVVSVIIVVVEDRDDGLFFYLRFVVSSIVATIVVVADDVKVDVDLLLNAVAHFPRPRCRARLLRRLPADARRWWRCALTWTPSPWWNRTTCFPRTCRACTRARCTPADTTRTWPCCWEPRACFKSVLPPGSLQASLLVRLAESRARVVAR